MRRFPRHTPDTRRSMRSMPSFINPRLNRGSVEQHVARLRLLPELEAIVVNWWDDPKVQRFFAGLGQIGV